MEPSALLGLETHSSYVISSNVRGYTGTLTSTYSISMKHGYGVCRQETGYGRDSKGQLRQKKVG